jgi:hypothetical protein
MKNIPLIKSTFVYMYYISKINNILIKNKNFYIKRK